MSGSATSFISARFTHADYLVRGVDAALSCPLWQSDALVEPSTGTCTVYDANGTSIDSDDVVVTGSIATRTVPAASLPSTLAFAEGWRVEWSLVVSGDTLVFRNEAALVRSALAPAASDQDLYRRVSGLDPNGSKPIHSLTDLQVYMDEAWLIILGKLTAKGRLPYLIVNSHALREPHILLALSLIFEDFATRLNEKHIETAQMYRSRFNDAWNDVRVTEDTDQDGDADGSRRVSVSGSMWMTSRG